MLPELIHSMRTGESPLYSVRNAIEALRIALAIFASDAAGGNAIRPDEVDPELRIENQ